VIDLESYLNKTVAFKFKGAELRFDLSHGLFSSFDIDVGTRLLLKTVARDPVLASARKVLDEGCGVGVIGLCVAKAFPEADVTLRDRDSLAVAFALRNRLGNKLRGTTAWTDPATGVARAAKPAPRVEWGLLADGREGGPYDFVLSNLPAKAGAPVLASFFARLAGGSPAPALLAPGGRAGVVVVRPLAAAAAAWIAEAGLEVVAEGRGSGHEVYVVERRPESGGGKEAEAAPPPEPYLGAYARGEARFKLEDLAYRARGCWGLPEFDTPSYGSSVAVEVASRAFSALRQAGGAAGASEKGRCSDALVIEPGVGHLAIWIARQLGPKRLTAASRDALALGATGINLAALSERSRPAYAAVDALGLERLSPGSFDLVAENPDIVPERDWIGPSWDTAGSLLKPGGIYLAYCPATEMARLEKRKPSGGAARWSLLCQKRKKGFVATAWRRG
jgi:16S rRNA G1207 methylase RsmC